MKSFGVIGTFYEDDLVNWRLLVVNTVHSQIMSRIIYHRSSDSIWLHANQPPTYTYHNLSNQNSFQRFYSDIAIRKLYWSLQVT